MSPKVVLPTRDPETPDVEDKLRDRVQSLHSNIGRVVIGQYQKQYQMAIKALKKTLRSRSNLHTASGSFCQTHFDPDSLVLTDRRHFFLHAHLILPFDTPLVFWGIFWLNQAKAKVQEKPVNIGKTNDC